MGHQKVGVRINKFDLYERYIRGKSWLCDKSPVQAHYWVEKEPMSERFECKYCGEKHRFPISWSGHIMQVSKKIGKSESYVQSAITHETSDIMPSMTPKLDKTRMSFRRV